MGSVRHTQLAGHEIVFGAKTRSSPSREPTLLGALDQLSRNRPLAHSTFATAYSPQSHLSYSSSDEK